MCKVNTRKCNVHIVVVQYHPVHSTNSCQSIDYLCYSILNTTNEMKNVNLARVATFFPQFSAVVSPKQIKINQELRPDKYGPLGRFLKNDLYISSDGFPFRSKKMVNYSQIITKRRHALVQYGTKERFQARLRNGWLQTKQGDIVIESSYCAMSKIFISTQRRGGGTL